MPLDLDRLDQIMATFAAMLERRSIAQELQDLKRYAVRPEQIDALVLAAIQTSFCLDDERLADLPDLQLEPAADAA